MAEPPVEIGIGVEDIPTPALILDIQKMKANIEEATALVKTAGLNFRPHAKSHKCPDIAKLQVEHGAIGVCCQTVAEAAAMVNGGVTDVLLTNQIVDPKKVQILAALNDRAKIGICVDHPLQVELLAKIMSSKDKALDVYVEADVGGNRCGVLTPGQGVELAKLISEKKNLNFKGLQAYQGKAQHILESKDRKKSIQGSNWNTGEFIQALSKEGLQCQIVTGGGTGTLEFDLECKILNEVQAGSFLFMDVHYLTVCRDDKRKMGTLFSPSLFILTTVISQNRPGVSVVDAGLKAIALDSGLPEIFENENLQYENPSDEHGLIISDAGAPSPKIGEKVLLVPDHCDPTVAKHSYLFGIEEGSVREIYPIIG